MESVCCLIFGHKGLCGEGEILLCLFGAHGPPDASLSEEETFPEVLRGPGYKTVQQERVQTKPESKPT